MVDDKTKEKYCYDSVDEGSEGSVITSKTSSTNDTCDGFKNMYSARNKSDQHKMQLSYMRSPNQHNIGKYQFFVRQNAFQSSPQNLRKEIAPSTGTTEAHMASTKHFQQPRQQSTVKSTDTEESALLCDSKSDSIVIGRTASSQDPSSMSLELIDPSLSEERWMKRSSRGEDWSIRTDKKNQRFSHCGRG